MKTVEKIASNLVKKIVIREQSEWPPICSGVIYQPERPVEKAYIDTVATVENAEVKDIRKK